MAVVEEEGTADMMITVVATAAAEEEVRRYGDFVDGTQRTLAYLFALVFVFGMFGFFSCLFFFCATLTNMYSILGYGGGYGGGAGYSGGGGGGYGAHQGYDDRHGGHGGSGHGGYDRY